MLHVWGKRSVEHVRGEMPPHGQTGTPLAVDPFITAAKLRRHIGDVWDSLLISGAADSELMLRLPDGEPTPPSTAGGTDDVASDTGKPQQALIPRSVESLAFAPADAVDFLAGVPDHGSAVVRCGASYRYWSCATTLVLEALAKQRFVPTVHRVDHARYRGYWRVVVDDETTSDRLTALIASMPPVCRSLAGNGDEPQASELVENFLWTTVDALVRRCLEGDELAHAIQDRPNERASAQMRWLRSLVSASPLLDGTPEECRTVFDTVSTWTATLEPAHPDRTCRTCFRLHATERGGDASGQASTYAWRLTIHVQALQEPDWVIDAAQLRDDAGSDPRVLKRPFTGAREQLTADLEHAGKHFPPLAKCAEPTGPLECELSLADAYRFLRDAAPVLRLEGFGIWLPKWWHDGQTRLKLQLDIRPLESTSAADSSGLGFDALVEYDWRIAVGDEDLTDDEITALAAAKEPLVKLRGRWTEVQPSDVQAALSFIESQRRGRMTVFEAVRQCYFTDHHDTGLPVAELSSHGWIDDLLNAADVQHPIGQVEPPIAFHGTLRPYQIAGLAWLTFLTRHGLGACLADDMGLGKTIQLIGLLLLEREPGEPVGPTLLIVPMSLVGNWRREIERFGPSLKVMVHHGLERLSGHEFIEEVAGHDVVVSTYGLAHRDFEHLAEVEWHRIALDEAQNIKNPAAKQSVAIRSLRSVHRVGLTGTPVENRLSELWSIMEFLNPSYLGNARDFRRRFAVPIERHHDTDRAERLRRLIKPFVLRRRKDDPNVLDDLPDKMEMKVYCNLTQEQAALYEALVGDMLGQIDRSAGIQRRGLILATLVKLKQICNHPAHFLADGSALTRRSGKCERLTEMLEEVVAEGDCALVFTQFRQMGTLLKALIRETLGVDPLFLHGGTTQRDRDKMVQRFQDGSAEHQVFLLSLKAGGFGLNLTAANHVFHFDRWWNPAVEDQATDRVHRIGQTKQVQVHKFVSIGTLEERIDALIEQKRALASHIVSGGEEWLTELSTDALREIFALSREAVAEA